MLNDKLDWQDAAIGASAAALGVGTAMALKYKKPTGELQRLSKGKLNWVTDVPSRFTTDRKNILDKFVGKLLYGDTKFYKVENAKDLKKLPRKLEGTTYYELDKTYNPKLYPKSDISYNKRTDVINKVFQNKTRFARLKGEAVAKGDSLSKKLGYPKEFDSFIHRLSKQENMYIKPSSEFASKGKTHISSADLKTLSEKLKNKEPLNPELKKRLEAAFKNQSKYVVQEEIPVKKYKIGPAKGMPKSERRIDFIYRKGKVIPIQKHRRWFGIDLSRINNKEFKQEFEKLVKQNPNLKKDLKDEAYILGADVVRDKNKKLKIIEINDQSGFLDPTVNLDKYVAHRLFKKVTGRDTGTARALKGTAAGTGGFVAGDLVVNNN